MMKVKILLIIMVIASILFFWYLYNTANAIDALQISKAWSKTDPLWWAKSTISTIVDGILDILKKLFGIV